MPAAKRTALHQTAVWKKTIGASADPARARHYLELLAGAGAGTAGRLKAATAEQARILAALFSGSPASAELLVAHPDWLDALAPELLRHPRREEGFRREVNAWLQPALATPTPAGEAALARLREFKQREMARIAARDLARLGDLPQITRELSALADVCLDSVLRVCRQQLRARFGQPCHADADGRWQPTEFTVIGLGKLGGQELNYSSDVDVVFVYSEEGHVFPEVPGRAVAPPKQAMTNHQFFKRLAEAFIAELTRPAREGTLFRVDLRLRPEGDVGPLVRSLGSYENFYAQWGQTWERMMLIKARGVAGDAALAAEFIETVQPFRYPRSLSENFLREVAAMKERVENEVVKAGALDRNVKLGRGGIREVEFVVQTNQLLHAGRQPFLQGPQTLPALEKLVEYHLLGRDEARGLAEAYCYLRDVEHRLQMEHYLQTHTIPTEAAARDRLAALMGCRGRAEFEAALQRHTRHVRQVYDKFLKPEQPEPQTKLPRQFEGAEAEWRQLLAAHSFQDADKAVRLLKEFAHGPGYGHVSLRTVELARLLIPRLLALCPSAETFGRELAPAKPDPQWRVLSDPDRVVTRLDSFVSAYGSRALLFETWASHPSLFELLLLLFDRSEHLAEIAIRTPDLVDELVLSGRLTRRKSAEEILRDLRYGRADKDQCLWLRRYHQAELMRIGLRDILGLADFEQNHAEVSALADACLQYALEVSLRKHRLKSAPLVVIGLGKLGGHEINYGSDLDVIFVADSAVKDLTRLQRVAVEVMDLVSRPTELGVAFATDARLRPDGEKGLLFKTLRAHEEYYRHRAQLWEIQALTRTRPVAGDLKLGEQFQSLAAALADFTPANVAAGFPSPEAPPARSAKRPTGRGGRSPARHTGLAAYTPGWKQQIHRMRQRIEKERTPAGKDALAIKTGVGGLMDAEFIAQTLCLANGWQEANTVRALERARAARALPEAEADRLIANYRQLHRVESILRRWSFAGEVLLPDHPAPLYRVAVRCGWTRAEDFLRALGECRAAIRRVYQQVLP